MIQHANDPGTRRAGWPVTPAAPGAVTPRRSGHTWPFLSPQVPRDAAPSRSSAARSQGGS